MINIQKLYKNPNLKVNFELPNNPNLKVNFELPNNRLLWNDLYLNCELSSITELTEEEQSQIFKKLSMDRERIQNFNSLIISQQERLEQIPFSDGPSISKMPENITPKFKSFKRF